MNHYLSLEQRYRRLLRLLPAWYRARWEEEMVTTYLDSALPATGEDDDFTLDFGRPRLSERVSVLGLAVRLRLGAAEAPPRSQLWGDALRRFALVGLLVAAVWGAVGVWQELWLSRRIPWPGVPAEVQAAAMEPSGWQAAASLTGLVWIAAFFALLSGRRGVAWLAAVLGLLWSAVETLPLLYSFGPPWPFTTMMLVGLLVTVVVVAAMAAFHQDAPSVPARGWVSAYVALVVVAVLSSSLLPQIITGPPTLFLDTAGIYSVALVVAGGWHLAGPRLRGRQRAAAWSLALALLAVVVLAVRISMLLPWVFMEPMAPRTSIAWGIGQVAMVATIGTVLAVSATRELQRRPVTIRPEARAT